MSWPHLSGLVPEEFEIDGLKTLTQPELNRILAEHERRAGAFRIIHTNLKHARLDGLNLANRMLAGIDLTGSSLVGATLFGSNLSHSRFQGADLCRCDLRNANLTDADLRGASLNRADLSYARLDNADLRAAIMMRTGTDGLWTVGREDAFDGRHGPPTVGVDFSNCSMKCASLGHARLQNANFTGALLEGAVFRGATLVDTVFHGAVLTGVDLKELAVPPEALTGCIFDVSQQAVERAIMLAAALEAHQRWVASDGKEGAPAVLDGEDLRPLGGEFAGRLLTALSARNTIAIGVDFSQCQLQGAKLEGADLRDANFTEADLAGASFRDAKLAHAVFTRADLARLDLVHGGSMLPDFAGADVSVDQFQDAKLDGALAAALAAASRQAPAKACAAE